MTREAWRLLRCALAGAIIGLLAHAVASGQTAPTSLCGFARVATPVASSVTNGAAVNASASGTSTITVPTIPILTGGNIIGATVQVAPWGGSIRVRTDSVQPGTSDGEVYTAGTFFSVCGSDLTTIRITASTSGTNSSTYWKFYTVGG